jgi:signal transduction histidine kinase
MDILFSLGSIGLIIAVGLNSLLIFMVYRNKPKSATSAIFTALGLLVSIWLVTNYLAVRTSDLTETLLLIRLGHALVTPINALFFLLACTIPHEAIPLRKRTLGIIASVTLAVMALCLSPYVLTGVQIQNGVPNPISGPGMGVFGIFSLVMNGMAAYTLHKRFRHASGPEKSQLRIVSWGFFAMFGCIILTIFLPTIFQIPGIFVQLLPVYTLFFLALTAYAIVRHRLFDIKVIATKLLLAILWIVLLAKTLDSQSPGDFVVSISILAAISFLAILLVRSVEREVSQRVKMEELARELKETNAKLADLDRFKTQLLSLASHQIKSPLAAIKGFVSLLLEGIYGPLDPKAQEALGKVKKSADGLVELINTLLDFRKVEEGRMTYDFARTDLIELIQETWEGIAPLGEAKHIRSTWVHPMQEAFVSADRSKLKQVIQNLLDNAIKYTPNGGSVALEIQDMGSAYMIAVKDSGLGIPQDLIGHLFEEFIRDERVRKEIMGTGLGLFIARKIIEAHGGRIWAESGGPNKGSVFSIALKKIA